MRMLLSAALAAAVVLAAVVFVGLRVLGDDEPAWSAQASETCERGLSDTLALIAASASVTDAEQRVLQVYEGSTDVEAGVLATLDSLPRPSGDEVEITETLRVVTESQRADLATLVRLRRNFELDVLQQRVDEATAVLQHARTRFDALGADRCVVYYDPASYE